MKHMYYAVASAIIAASVSGCASFKPETGSKMFASNKAEGRRGPGRSAADSQSLSAEFPGLKRALNQVNQQGDKGRAGGTPLLPPSLENSSLIQKMVRASAQAVEVSYGRSASEVKHDIGEKNIAFTRGDFRDFIKNVVPTLGVDSWTASATAPTGRSAASPDEERKAQTYRRIQKYLMLYFWGKFVDRSGSSIAKPKIENNKLGNDSIVGFETVILEAIYDDLYETPVFYEKDNAGKIVWFNAGAKEPTFAALTKDNAGNYDAALVVDTSVANCSITRDEVHAAQFLSGVASDQSKLISGFILRIFNDVTLSYVIGGQFSIGDNDTLAKVADTFFELSSGRTTEALAYSYFKDHDTNDYGTGLADLVDLAKQVYDKVR